MGLPYPKGWEATEVAAGAGESEGKVISVGAIPGLLLLSAKGSSKEEKLSRLGTLRRDGGWGGPAGSIDPTAGRSSYNEGASIDQKEEQG